MSVQRPVALALAPVILSHTSSMPMNWFAAALSHASLLPLSARVSLDTAHPCLPGVDSAKPISLNLLNLLKQAGEYQCPQLSALTGVRACPQHRAMAAKVQALSYALPCSQHAQGAFALDESTGIDVDTVIGSTLFSRSGYMTLTLLQPCQRLHNH